MTRQRTRITLTVMVAAAAVLLAGCSTTPPGGAPSTKHSGPYTLGISSSGQSLPYVAGIAAGMEKEAKKLGAKVIITDAQNDANKQSSDIQDLIAQQVSGILIIPVDGTVGQGQVDTITAAGIPVVAAGSQIGDPNKRAQDDVYPALVGLSIQNELTVGKQAADIVLKALPDGGQLGVVLGAPGYAEDTLRMKDFTSTLDKASASYKIVGQQPGQWTPDAAQAVCQNMLSGNPDINLFYTLSDDMAVGCSKALSATDSKAKIVSVGGYKEVLDLMRQPDTNIAGTVCFSASKMGGLAVKTLVNYLDGTNTKKGQFVNYKTFPVTPENVGTCPGAF